MIYPAGMISASQMIYASRMMGTDIIMSAANNKVPGYPLEIFDFVSGSGSYIILAKQVYHTATPYIISPTAIYH